MTATLWLQQLAIMFHYGSTVLQLDPQEFKKEKKEKKKSMTKKFFYMHTFTYLNHKHKKLAQLHLTPALQVLCKHRPTHNVISFM